MLTKKALAQNVTATYCSTSNTMFLHNSKQKHTSVHSNNVQRVIRNCTAAQVAAFKQLPQTYMQAAKRFPHTVAAHFAKIITS